MQEFRGCASARIDAAPEAIFDLITDIDRLPDWNTAIEALVRRPPVLVRGVEWEVTMHPPRKRHLAREVPRSLAAIGAAVTARSASRRLDARG
jgi:uncharacterized protein YndB with AHSA1/START domain